MRVSLLHPMYLWLSPMRQIGFTSVIGLILGSTRRPAQEPVERLRVTGRLGGRRVFLVVANCPFVLHKTNPFDSVMPVRKEWLDPSQTGPFTRHAADFHPAS